MALTNGQLLSPPGGPVNLGAVKQGSNIAITADGTINNTSSIGVNSIISGSNIFIDNSTGIVLVTYTGGGGGAGEDDFPVGTRMVFVQSSAPTGWSRNAVDQTSLRLVSDAGGGTGGSNDFTSAFTNQNITGSLNSTVTWSNSGTDQTDVLLTGQGNNLIVTNSNDFSIGGNESPVHNHTIEGMFDDSQREDLSFDTTGGGMGVNAVQTSNRANNNDAHNHSVNFSPLFAGSGGSHNHPLSVSGSVQGTVAGSTLTLGVKYKDSIICTKQ